MEDISENMFEILIFPLFVRSYILKIASSDLLHFKVYFHFEVSQQLKTLEKMKERGKETVGEKRFQKRRREDEFDDMLFPLSSFLPLM